MGNACTRSVALVLALAGCAPGDAEPLGEAAAAIEGGHVDVGDRGVVGLAVVDASGYPRRACTGSLIAPDLVLTAQHCIADTGKFVDCSQSVFGAPVEAERVRVTESPAMWDANVPWCGARAILTPPGGAAVCGRDVALVVLERPLGGPLLAPRLDDLVHPGEPYAAIGYGRSSGRAEDGGMRRRRDALRVVCVGEGCRSLQVEDGEWRGDHGICNGDSGGPALDEDGDVIGVTSRGPTGCERPIYGALAPHQGWLRREAAAAAERGGYPAPAWAGDLAPRAPAYHPPGCAAAPAPPGAAPAWGPVLLAALAARARTRRRSACVPRPPQ